MPLSNDERGWVMTGLSGVACIFGASFICIDIIVRRFPGKKNFRIQDSDAFLSISLSLSFGVMLFSALYSMLPSSKRSLQEGGFTAKEASWIMIACFVGGVVGIQILSQALHQFVPHDIVSCEHKHGDDEEASAGHDHSHHAGHDLDGHAGHDVSVKVRKTTNRRRSTLPGHVPLAARPAKAQSYFTLPNDQSFEPTAEAEQLQNESEMTEAEPGATLRSRPSFYKRLTTGLSKLATGKNAPEECDGECYGYEDVCGQDCFKSINTRRAASFSNVTTETTPLLKSTIKENYLGRPRTRAVTESAVERQQVHAANLEVEAANHKHPDSSDAQMDNMRYGHDNALDDDDDGETQHENHDPIHDHDHHVHLHSPTHETTQSSHHHHVPQNAFLSIGLQTSIAIALHKLPEGFITYATNHANPKLGVSVFLALFIHNITEGFALALPLYLAINNRLKAMLISFVLGGLSQPLGAGVAALWFKLAGTSNWAPSEGIYGGMFAVTAGIMASVALQLFSESLDLTHSKMLCMVGAFTGMTILGISGALTA